MTTGKQNKTVLTLAAVAIVALAIGQVQAETINVPNNSFELIYKPGETTITADLGGGSSAIVASPTREHKPSLRRNA